MNTNNHLNQSELLGVITKFESESSNLEIDVMFTDSNFSRRQIYKGYKLLTDENDILPTVTGSIKYVKEEVSNRSFEKYDLELSMDDTVQIVEKDSVINGGELLSKMNQVISNTDDVLDDKVKLHNLNFIVIKLYDSVNNKNMYLFQKYVHPTSKYRSAFKYTLHGKTAKLFNEEVLTINSSVDAILYDANYYILNRNNFNSIFNFKDIFYKIINDNKQKIKESNLFVTSEAFIEDCIQDGRFLPRLTKVILAEGFNTVNNNKNKLPELKQQYSLSFTLTNDNRIEYTDKSQVSDIINVLLDHFVISALTDKKMLAKAIEKYEI